MMNYSGIIKKQAVPFLLGKDNIMNEVFLA
jgi:hypothetical protein